MTEFDAIQLIVSAAAMLLASTIFTALGFGIGLVGLPFLLLVIDPQSSIMTLNISALVLVTWIIIRNYQHVRLRETLSICVAGVVGGLTGAFIIANADERVLEIAILVLIIIFAVITAFNIEIPVPYPRFTGVLIGFVVATLITSVGIGGPLLVLFMLARDWDRHSVRASMALFFVFMISSATIGYAVGGLFTFDRLILLLAVLPTVLLGAWLGNRIANSINDRVFRVVVVTLIITASLVALTRQIVQL